jgi:rod shape-determining protein MreC
MHRRKQILIFSIAGLLALVILGLPEQSAQRIKRVLGGVFLPLFGLVHSSTKTIESAGNTVIPKADLIRELDQLRRDHQELKVQASQYQEIIRENNRLREALGWAKRTGWKLQAAQVIGRDPANWWRTVHIDLGQRDGIRENLPVLTADGLIGRIFDVGMTRSQVVLLGDPKCRVAALVPEAKDSGIIAAGSPTVWDHNFVELGFLSRTSQLHPGQKVITSGMGGIFPAGIPIGIIVDMHGVDGLYVQARVKLAANLNNLEDVWVMQIPPSTK